MIGWFEVKDDIVGLKDVDEGEIVGLVGYGIIVLWEVVL